MGMSDLVEANVRVHPLVLGLIQSLPPPGTRWSPEQRARWLKVAEHCVALLYHDTPEQRSRTPTP
jgi:hypothetical protein